MNNNCKTCGHDKVFHRIGGGNGVPVGQEYCDDRHGDKCSCRKFVELPGHVEHDGWAQSLASPSKPTPADRMHDAVATFLIDVMKDECTPHWIRIRACEIASMAYGYERRKV